MKLIERTTTYVDGSNTTTTTEKYDRPEPISPDHMFYLKLARVGLVAFIWLAYCLTSCVA